MFSGEDRRFEHTASVQLRNMAELLGPDTTANPYAKIAYAQLNAAANLEAVYESSHGVSTEDGWAGTVAEPLGKYAIWYGNIALSQYVYVRAGAQVKWKLFTATRTDPRYYDHFDIWQRPVTDDMERNESADEFHAARLAAQTHIELFNYRQTADPLYRDYCIGQARSHRQEIMGITIPVGESRIAPSDVDLTFVRAGHALDVFPPWGEDIEMHGQGYAVMANAGGLGISERALANLFGKPDGKLLRWVDKRRKGYQPAIKIQPGEWSKASNLVMLAELAPDLMYEAGAVLPMPVALRLNLAMGDFANAQNLHHQMQFLNQHSAEVSDHELLAATLLMAQYYRLQVG